MRKQIGGICYGMSKKLYSPANALIFYNALPASPFATGIVFEVEGDGMKSIFCRRLNIITLYKIASYGKSIKRKKSSYCSSKWV